MALKKEIWHETRVSLQKLLSAQEPGLRDNAELCAQAFVPQSSAIMHLPVKIGQFHNCKHF